MSVVFGGIILTVFSGAIDRLFSGSRLLKVGVFAGLFIALFAAVRQNFFAFGSVFCLSGIGYVFLSAAIGFYGKNVGEKLFLTYASVLAGVFLYFCKQAGVPVSFSTDVISSANGVFFCASLVIFVAKSTTDAVASAAISMLTFSCFDTTVGKFGSIMASEVLFSTILVQCLTSVMFVYAQKIARIVAPDAAFMIDESKRT